MITPWSKQPQKAVLHHPHGRTPLRRISVLLRLTCPEFPIHATAHPIILALIHTTAAAATPIFAALSSHPDHPWRCDASDSAPTPRPSIRQDALHPWLSSTPTLAYCCARASMPPAHSSIHAYQIVFLDYFFWQNLHWFYCYFTGNMAPRATRRTVDEIDREFDELASVLSDPREQLITSGIYRIHTFGSIKYFLCIKKSDVLACYIREN